MALHVESMLVLSTIVQLEIFTKGSHVATIASVTSCVLRSMWLLMFLFGVDIEIVLCCFQWKIAMVDFCLRPVIVDVIHE